MRLITLYVYIILMQLSFTAAAQSYHTEAYIEYEHKTHVRNLWKEQEMDERIIQAMPSPYRISYHDLFFKGTTSLYRPGRDPDGPQAGWTALHPQNIIYMSHDSGVYIGQKNIFEEQFLVADSMPHIDWKITFDTRVIQGYNCRKAIGKICDSVVVVAFYADQLIIPSGPESFNGLPGLILGLVIPRMHTSWYATKIQVKTIKPEEIKIPTKGKKTRIKGMLKELEEALQGWGNYKHRAMWIASF
jgi:GLPGLI family protein